MTKRLLGVFTTIVTALAVVGVAWAGTGADTSASIAADTSAQVETSTSQDDGSSSTVAATVDSSTSTSVDDDRNEDSSTTSTSVASTTSTSAADTTSTSVDDDDDDDDATSTTSTTLDDRDGAVVPDEITTHTIPGVGAVTIEAFAGQLFLVSVSAPGWEVEHDKIESDRIELEFIKGDAEAEFEARIHDARVEVRIEVDLD